MITYSGRKVYPRNHELFCDEWPTLVDMAVGLCRQSRFAGQTRAFYTVFCHSLVAHDIAPQHVKLHALLHDLPECVMSDVPTTWKPESFKILEKEILEGFYAANNLTLPTEEELAEVAKVDFACLVAEAHVLGHVMAQEVWPLGSFMPEMNEMIDEARRLTSGMVLGGNVSSYMDLDTAIEDLRFAFNEAISGG